MLVVVPTVVAYSVTSYLLPACAFVASVEQQASSVDLDQTKKNVRQALLSSVFKGDGLQKLMGNAAIHQATDSAIKGWRRSIGEDFVLSCPMQKLMDRLFNGTSGYAIYMADIAKKAGSGSSWSPASTYGETDVCSFVDHLKLLPASTGGSFYDLGSGLGKTLMAAFMLGDFDKVVGIELSHSLHNASMAALAAFHHQVLPKLPPQKHGKTLTAIHGDYTSPDLDLSQASVVFIDIALGNTKVLALELARQLKPGTQIITCGEPLPAPMFQQYASMPGHHTYGIRTSYFQTKVL